MIETEITISVNRKTDLETIKGVIVSSRIGFPVYFFEYNNHYEIRFKCDYEAWEMDNRILDSFPDYEFATHLDNGRKEIRLQVSRYQSELSTDDWGRRIVNPLDETKYMVRKSAAKAEGFNPHVKVMFDGQEKDYYVNIIDGINKQTGQKGYLILDEFRTADSLDDVDFLKDRLYASREDAFHDAYYKMEEEVTNDYEGHVAERKKELTNLQRIPRKTVRDFIKFCNEADYGRTEEILDKDVVFDKEVDGKLVNRTIGVAEFLAYISSPEQDLCGMDFKIRSTWHIKLPILEIGIKYFPVSPNIEGVRIEKNRKFTFKVLDGRISSITENRGIGAWV